MNETYRHLYERDRLQERELAGAPIAPLSEDELLSALAERESGERLGVQTGRESGERLGIQAGRKAGERLDFSRRRLAGADLSGKDLSNIDFSCTRFEGVNFDGAVMDACDVRRCFFVDCGFRGVSLTNSRAADASFRTLDLTGCDFSGTNFYYAAFDYAVMEDIRRNAATKWLGDGGAPETGPFIAWKVGGNRRVIEMLVPAEARRTCSTYEAGRCEFAKVLAITSPDFTESYTWENAMVDDSFLYEVGKMVYPANGFDPYPWLSDAAGIHFFTDRDMAISFGTGYY